jgi:hypothetical protein
MLPGGVGVYLHPLGGLAAIALALYTASLGLRSRRARGDVGWARRRHARIGPCLYTLVLLNWAAGLAAVRWLRPEIEAAASGHFAAGSTVAALFTAVALVGLRVPRSPRARALHPVLGAAALLLLTVQVFLGLQLLP